MGSRAQKKKKKKSKFVIIGSDAETQNEEVIIIEDIYIFNDFLQISTAKVIQLNILLLTTVWSIYESVKKLFIYYIF